MGNTDLLLSIIKLIEDKMNLDHDIEEGGVQQIILVEDNIRFYSSVLPELYKFVLQQSMEFATEALNEHQRTLRMRGRPKIVLARHLRRSHRPLRPPPQQRAGRHHRCALSSWRRCGSTSWGASAG